MTSLNEPCSVTVECPRGPCGKAGELVPPLPKASLKRAAASDFPDFSEILLLKREETDLRSCVVEAAKAFQHARTF